jgi:hypothetical protein
MNPSRDPLDSPSGCKPIVGFCVGLDGLTVSIASLTSVGSCEDDSLGLHALAAISAAAD